MFPGQNTANTPSGRLSAMGAPPESTSLRAIGSQPETNGLYSR